MEVGDNYATLQPDGSITVTEGDIVNFICSTNLPATYARWEINNNKYSGNLPPGFTTNGFNLEFSVEATVTIRCFFRIMAGDICSNVATVSLLNNASPQNSG